MWGKDKTKKVDFDRHAGKTTMIAKGTVIDGDVRFEGGLLVEGTIKGNVRADDGSEALLRLSEAGKIEGEIHVPNVVVNGKVNGDVHSSAHVELAAKAVVKSLSAQKNARATRGGKRTTNTGVVLPSTYCGKGRTPPLWVYFCCTPPTYRAMYSTLALSSSVSR